ncbi:GAF domain-containing protein [Leptothoe sp. ISB3NOV94-8A]
MEERAITRAIFLITSSDPSLSKKNPCGTGFCIYKDQKYSYVVTCHHVVEDVGGNSFLLVNNKKAELISNNKSVDLAILKVENFLKSFPLNLTPGIVKGQICKIHGYAAFVKGKSHRLRTLEGTVGEIFFQTQDKGEVKVESWDLIISNKENRIHKNLRGGYSGSPVVNSEGQVLGVVNLQLNSEGSLGAAISINYVEMVWPKLPSDVKKQLKPQKKRNLFPATNRLESINVSQILSKLRVKFREAPENVTDPDWMPWFSDMLVLQRKALEEITFSIGSMLGAHRTTVYFLSSSGGQEIGSISNSNELWSLLAQGESSLEIRVPIGEGVSGTVAATQETIFIPSDAYEKAGELSETIINQDEITGYRTYNLLTAPLLSEDGNLIAVFQFLNKLNSHAKSRKDISPNLIIGQEDIDKLGFSNEDYEIFNSHMPAICLIIELYQDHYRQFRKLQSIVNFSSATLKLSRENQSLEDILNQVIDEACRITEADRGTFWLLDSQRKRLRAKVPSESGKWQEIRIKVGEGFAGKVAKTKKTLNIPFDLYNHPDSAKSRETDASTGYRTCSLLCMPVFSRDDSTKLIGVTQLLNKRTQQSIRGQYNASNFSDKNPPSFFKASFSDEDEARLERFNDQVAAAIESAQRPIMAEQYKNLHELIQVIAQVAGSFLNAHRARIFFVNEESEEAWTIVANENHDPFEVSVPFGRESVGKVAISHSPEIFNKVHQDELELAFTQAKANNECSIHSKLLFPIFSPRTHPKKNLAIIEFVNKLKPDVAHGGPFSYENLDDNGFTEDDIANFRYNHEGSIFYLINGFLDAYKPVYQYREGEKLRKAKEFMIQSGANTPEALDKLMVSARELVGAHRSTLWRVDPDDQDILYACVPSSEGGTKRISVTIGEGYVGQAADRTLEALNNLKFKDISFNEIMKRSFLNIGFDLYDDRNRSAKARKTDRETKYRTCSLLCVPILSPDRKLLGVIQLLNKMRRGFENQVQDVYKFGEPLPRCFMASFTKQNEKQMADFCADVGDILGLLEVQNEITNQRKMRAVQARIDRIKQQG